MRFRWERLNAIFDTIRSISDLVKTLLALGITGAISFVISKLTIQYSTHETLTFFSKSWPLLLIFTLILFIATLVTYYRYTVIKRRLRQYASVTALWSRLANDSTHVEQEIFDLLYEYLNGNRVSENLLNEIRRTCRNHLRDLLNCAADVFTIQTGSQCAACIKSILVSTDTPAEDWGIRTVLRDSTSHTKRQHYYSTQRVRDNTAYIRIVRDRWRYYLSNDLKNEGSYVNTRQDWNDALNATLVHPIPALQRQGPPRPELPAALICIDNVDGGFDLDVSIRYVEEFAWRVAIVWYQISEVGQK